MGDCHKIFTGSTVRSPIFIDRENRPAVPFFRATEPTDCPPECNPRGEHTVTNPTCLPAFDTPDNPPGPYDYTKEGAPGRPSMTLDELDREFTALRDRVRTIRGYL